MKTSIFSENLFMPSKQNTYKKPDFWSQKAFREGYPARSVYKLEEIDEKFGLLKKGSSFLDLGASPGSWTVWLLRHITPSGKVVAVDLNPLSKDVKDDRLFFFQGDMTSEEVRKPVSSLGPYDAVVCDAAPLTTGNRTVDTLSSLSLSEMAVWYAENMLKPGGNFCVKVFQGGETQSLLQKMRTLFSQAKGFKPNACRSSSFETYMVGLNKKA